MLLFPQWLGMLRQSIQNGDIGGGRGPVMRLALVAGCLLALSGCVVPDGAGGSDGALDGESLPEEGPVDAQMVNTLEDIAAQAMVALEQESYPDTLTERLPEGSGGFFGDVVGVDSVEVPGGGSARLDLRTGLFCGGSLPIEMTESSASAEGDVLEPVIACMARLAGDPTAATGGVREASEEFGFTLTPGRIPVETIEWRFLHKVVGLRGGEPVSETSFDSGWRPVSFTPSMGAPKMIVEAIEPCDHEDWEEQLTYQRGWAHARLLVDAAFVGATVRAHFGGSMVEHYDGSHGGYYGYPAYVEEIAFAVDPVAGPLTMEYGAHVDLETEGDEPVNGFGPCNLLTVGKETQVWTLEVTYTAADGTTTTQVSQAKVPVFLATGLV
jgi:hypothetical protein